MSAQADADVVDDARVQHFVHEDISLVVLGRQKHKVILQTPLRRSRARRSRVVTDRRQY